MNEITPLNPSTSLSNHDQALNRMLSDHPHLSERYLPLLNDTAANGRNMAITALCAVMDYLDLKYKADEAMLRNNDNISLADRQHFVA